MYVFGGTIDNNIRSGEMYRFQVCINYCNEFYNHSHYMDKIIAWGMHYIKY